MRKIIPLALALLAASATLATADGLMLRWQDCSGDGGGAGTAHSRATAMPAAAWSARSARHRPV
jgi:hypothetical protein